MNEYEVLIAFEQHEKGDVIKMNTRQSKYLLMEDKIKLKTKKPQVKGKK